MTRAAGLALLVFLLGAPWAVQLGASGYVLSVATRAAILAVAAVSLQFILGFGGLVSFGHAATVGIGAYAVSVLADRDAWLVLPAAMAAAAVFAGVTGVVALRARGVTFIMITLAFGQMAYFVAQSLALYGGDDGMALDGRTPAFGTPALEGRATFHYAVVVSLALLAAAYRVLALSRFGRALRAARENEERVATLGFDVFRIRLAAYIAGGAGGGLAGFWMANNSEYVSPALLDWRASGHLLVMVILGSAGPFGRSVDGRLVGAAAGATALIVAEDWLAVLTPHWPLLLGPALVAVALLVRR